MNKDLTVQQANAQIDTDNIDLILRKPQHTLAITISTKDQHPTLGMDLLDTSDGPQLKACLRGTQSAKIPQWRHTILNGTVKTVQGIPTSNVNEVQTAISSLKQSHANIDITFATQQPVSIHPETGIPQMHFDQLAPLSHVLHDLKHDESPYRPDLATDQMDPYINKLDKPTLTRKRLQTQDDWNEWQNSEWLQLDQYVTQDMFDEPGDLPTDLEDINVLPMIWTYLVKSCGRKKARCVANGAPHLKGSVTLANTYAACLEQTAARVFWAIAAIQGKQVFGSDASNAFGEAPPPKAPLFLRVDQAYREWYKHRTGQTLPDASYVRVKHAIQGHPESPRLWQEHIDKILRSLDFIPTVQEPCLYKYAGTKYTAEDIYLLRQVDDFAVACDNENTANKIWNDIDSKLSAPLKKEGLLRRHNGIDIEQARHHIKIHCSTYITKITSNKAFLTDMKITSNKPIPMRADNEYIQQFDTTKGPTDVNEQTTLEQRMGFKYRQATGELLFAMVTCRPDISVAVMKLTQHNHNPAEIHFKAAMDVNKYLSATPTKGIQYWRAVPQPHLPIITPQTPMSDSEFPSTVLFPGTASDAYGYVDSDWGGNVDTRKSISGVAIILGGAVVAYKTINQKSVALSSTEAEFYALAEAGKMMLYIRSILNDLALDQTKASILFEDNQGCICMTDARKPTKRTRHVDIRHFAVLDWVEQDLLQITKIPTAENSADTLTKSLGRVLFHRHTDRLLGCHVPTYSSFHNAT